MFLYILKEDFTYSNSYSLKTGFWTAAVAHVKEDKLMQLDLLIGPQKSVAKANISHDVEARHQPAD